MTCAVPIDWGSDLHLYSDPKLLSLWNFEEFLYPYEPSATHLKEMDLMMNNLHILIHNPEPSNPRGLIDTKSARSLMFYRTSRWIDKAIDVHELSSRWHRCSSMWQELPSNVNFPSNLTFFSERACMSWSFGQLAQGKAKDCSITFLSLLRKKHVQQQPTHLILFLKELQGEIAFIKSECVWLGGGDFFLKWKLKKYSFY